MDIGSSWIEYKPGNISKVENVWGVYLIAVKLNSGNKKVVYVGSGNVRERFTAHLSDSEPNACIRDHVKEHYCYFDYKEVQGGEDARKKAETELIKQYKKTGKAECNENLP